MTSGRMPEGAHPDVWRQYVTIGEGFCPRGHGKLRSDDGGCVPCRGTWTINPDPMAEYDAVEWRIFPELLEQHDRGY